MTTLPNTCPHGRPVDRLTRAGLDRTQCPDPGCDCRDLIVLPRCHPAAGLTAAYIAATGCVRLTCRECEAVVCDVAVAAN